VLDDRRGTVVQDHVHAGEAGGGGILLLPVEGDLGAGFVAHFEEEGTGAAGWVVDGGAGTCTASACRTAPALAPLDGVTVLDAVPMTDNSVAV
jgi:hypothetical protein